MDNDLDGYTKADVAHLRVIPIVLCQPRLGIKVVLTDDHARLDYRLQYPGDTDLAVLGGDGVICYVGHTGPTDLGPEADHPVPVSE